jgi:hypothetical protein
MQPVRLHGVENNVANCLWNIGLKEISVMLDRDTEEKASGKVDVY